MRFYLRIFKLIGLLCLFFTAPAAYAADLDTVLTNLSKIIHPFTVLVLVISFLGGVTFIWRGIGMFKKFGMTGQMAQPGEIAGPLVYIFVGTILIFLPTTTQITIASIFGENEQGTSIFKNKQVNFPQDLGRATDDILGYIAPGLEDKWGHLANTLVLYIQFVGFLAFVRGWFIIAKSGNPGVQQGSIAKGITHIVGGIIAVNFVTTVTFVRNTIFGT
jgi:intracellular multiplication protein IcmC